MRQHQSAVCFLADLLSVRGDVLAIGLLNADGCMVVSSWKIYKYGNPSRMLSASCGCIIDFDL